jgi:asparagine synthase (glutamine-hydrolysing)
MCEVLAHRGPDDAGIWCDGPIGLGHARLSVIDLSDAGRQPMANEDGSLWIVLNGEIYNFLELRHELEQQGLPLPHPHRHRGAAPPLRPLRRRAACTALRGMFAFAIWDVRRRELFLARDRVGKKPLCYHADAHGITFGLRDQGGAPGSRGGPRAGPGGDPSLPHLPVRAGAAERVQRRAQAAPGHYLIARDGRYAVRRYWKLSHRPKFTPRNERERRALEVELLERLDEATALRMAATCRWARSSPGAWTRARSWR